MKVLRIIATILSGPMLLMGVLSMIQGLGILPHVFAPGARIWALQGVPMVLLGAGLVWWVNRGGQTR